MCIRVSDQTTNQSQPKEPLQPQTSTNTTNRRKIPQRRPKKTEFNLREGNRGEETIPRTDRHNEIHRSSQVPRPIHRPTSLPTPPRPQIQRPAHKTSPKETKSGVRERDKSSAVRSAGDDMATGMGRAIGDDHRPESAAAEEGQEIENGATPAGFRFRARGSKKMDRYQKVEKPKPESPVNQNEIRITSQGLVRNYISYATTLLQEREVTEIVLKAMGQAISKTVAVAEIIKRRIPGLHQDSTISSVSITDTFEPIEEGLQTVEQTRHVSMISITLSTKDLNKNSPGYQAPSNTDQTRQQYNHPPQQRQPPRQVRGGYNSGNGDSYGRGSGRGRGRGRGWNRGGYSNYQENGGWYQGGYSGGYQGGYSGGNGGGYSGGNRGGYSGGHRGGYSGGNDGGYSRGNGGYQGGYSGGYPNWGRGGGRGGWGYRGDGYGRGRGGGGRGFVRGRGRMGGRGGGGGLRGGGNQA
ncbi:Alba DNA/RNA-binding protein [Striga hermonthica]|uniref:Alba DNA/RNA-binding protein n=1 Tax=Striga hermonthica TaxID=68872 RepID=A0A9N7MT66_STRHE|nr:Alba DNA/RNA-binding protein [Striga hermonthica]